MGNCNHRKYIPILVEMVRTGAIDPSELLTEVEGITEATGAFRNFDERLPGWIEVAIAPTLA
jgi:threonine dehydrogenase-like Zn-dependent dehydrogenase